MGIIQKYMKNMKILAKNSDIFLRFWRIFEEYKVCSRILKFWRIFEKYEDFGRIFIFFFLEYEDFRRILKIWRTFEEYDDSSFDLLLFGFHSFRFFFYFKCSYFESLLYVATLASQFIIKK
jgi:hypothetical protein